MRREGDGENVAGGEGVWFRVGMVVFSRELDESSALRWMTGTKGRVSLWSAGEEWVEAFRCRLGGELLWQCSGAGMRYQYIGI